MPNDKYNDISDTDIYESGSEEKGPTSVIDRLNEIVDTVYEDIILNERRSAAVEAELKFQRNSYIVLTALSFVSLCIIVSAIIVAVVTRRNNADFMPALRILMKYVLPFSTLLILLDTLTSPYRRLKKELKAVQNRTVLLNSSLNGYKERRGMALKGEEVSTEYTAVDPLPIKENINYFARAVLIILLCLLWGGYSLGSYVLNKPQRISGTSSVIADDDMDIIPNINEAGQTINAETDEQTDNTETTEGNYRLEDIDTNGKLLNLPGTYSEAALNGEVKNVTYEWECKFSKWTQSMDIPVRNYEYFKLRRRTIDGMDYAGYIEDKTDDAFIKSLADTMCKNGADKGYDELEQVELLVSFVQSLDYIEDVDEDGNAVEYPKYPIETLYYKGGDCEDTSILLASLLRARGYQTALIKLPEHIAVGVKGTSDGMTGSYYELNGDRYYYIETTNKNWAVGEIPEEYKGQDAELIVVN
jgi:hypothetical protein